MPDQRIANTAITQVEFFINQLHNGDIFIAKEAQNLTLSRKTESSFWSSDKRVELGTLADMLGMMIAQYQSFRETALRERAAVELLDYIERARTHGVIIPQRLTSDLLKAQLENAQLKEENNKLVKENQRLTELNEGLHQVIDAFGLKRVSDDEGEGEPEL